MAIQRGFFESVVVSQEGGWSRPLGLPRPSQAVAVGGLEGDGIPPPDAGIHAGVGEEVAAVHLQLLDDVLGVAQHQRVVRVKLVDEAVEGGDVGERGLPAGDALFGAPAEQAGMMAEGQDAAADLLPLGLLNGLAGQLDHHAHAVGPGLVEQALELGVVGVDRVVASPVVMP